MFFKVPEPVPEPEPPKKQNPGAGAGAEKNSNGSASLVNNILLVCVIIVMFERNGLDVT